MSGLLYSSSILIVVWDSDTQNTWGAAPACSHTTNCELFQSSSPWLMSCVTFIQSSTHVIWKCPFICITCTHTPSLSPLISNESLITRRGNELAEENKCGLININQHSNMINGFSEVLCWQNYCLSNSSASARVKFPDGADVLPSIIDHFIQLISCWFVMHLKCQTLMLSIRHWKWENTLFFWIIYGSFTWHWLGIDGIVL